MPLGYFVELLEVPWLFAIRPCIKTWVCKTSGGFIRGFIRGFLLAPLGRYYFLKANKIAKNKRE